jgi:hypothetical protein
MKGKGFQRGPLFFVAILKNRALAATCSRIGRFTGLPHGCKLDDYSGAFRSVFLSDRKPIEFFLPQILKIRCLLS